MTGKKRNKQSGIWGFGRNGKVIQLLERKKYYGNLKIFNWIKEIQ